MKRVHGSSILQSDFARIGRIVFTAVALLRIMLLPSAWAASPTSSAPAASGYEIPLGELHKVKKERPAKKEIKTRKKVKTENAPQPAADAVIPSEKVEQTPTAAPALPNREISSEIPQQPASEKTVTAVSSKSDAQQATTVPVTIHHDPYSYVIAGKRTTIQAVISSADSIKDAYCRFRAVEGGAYARMPMVLVSGTSFTYTATLPSLAAASRSLRYSVVAVDSLGNEARSQEFVITVKPSAVRPGWQLEGSQDAIKMRLESREKPLEGFSDSGIVVE